MNTSGTGSFTRREVLQLTAVMGLSAGFGGGVLALLRRGRLHRATSSRVQMGTEVSITVLHPDPEVARGLVERAFGEIERLEMILSRHRPEAPLARLARHGEFREAPDELVEVLVRAGEYAADTDGAFDITVLPLLELVRDRAGKTGAHPDPEELRDVLQLVDFRAIRLEGKVVSLARPGMALTLDGIAKGYVVDRAVDFLVQAGAGEVTVEAGGDLAVGGLRSRPRKWAVSIRDPESPWRILGAVRVEGQGVATSGDYVQAFTQDGRSHHILDPRTGGPALAVRAVTVSAPSAMDADALSTSALVLGPEAGLRLLEEREGVEGILFARDGRTLRTSGFPIPS